MNINDIFPSKYLKAADLKGGTATVVIARCEMEQVGDDKKLVIYFQGKQKGMITNRTNADRISYMYSPDTDEWIGKEITIFPDMVSFQGKTMEALRVRPPQQRNGSAKPQSPPPSTTPPQYVMRQSGKATIHERVRPELNETDGDDCPF